MLPRRLLLLELAVGLGRVYLGAMVAMLMLIAAVVPSPCPGPRPALTVFCLGERCEHIYDVRMTPLSEVQCLCIVLVIFGVFPLVRARLVCYPRFDNVSMFPK